MKVLEPGDGRTGWGIEIRCSGSGNGGGGCHAQLLVEENDVFHSYASYMGRDEDHFFTFKCPQCGVWTDIPDERVPGWLRRQVINLKTSVPGREPYTLGQWKKDTANGPTPSS